MRFRGILLCTVLIACSYSVSAQFMEPKINPEDPTLPGWVKLMYAEPPNVYRVDSAYQAYYREVPFKETSYTRYYLRWRLAVSREVNEEGYVVPATLSEKIQLEERIRSLHNKGNNAPASQQWSFAGPRIHLRAKYSAADSVFPLSEQANTYCIDQSVSNPDLLFCGTESGGVYKSTDKGAHWTLVSQGLLIYSVSAIAINPFNENEVMFGASGFIYKTTDGGSTWQLTGSSTFQQTGVNPWQIEYNPSNPMIVYAACDKGFYRTTDGGANWTQILPYESMSVAIKPYDANTVYALQYNPNTKSPDFYKSVNGGLTFSIRPSGWFAVPPGDLGKIESHGGRIAVTKANPNRVYVLLVGNSDSAAGLQLGGYIGVYSSQDAGESWTLPQQLIGKPYDPVTHPNLMDFDGYSSTYNQIYYNTALIVSQLNENRLLIGGLNLWRSDDGAVTYQPVGGYIGTIPYLHVDIQELKVYRTSSTSEEVWIASDGGVNYSTDFVDTHDSRCNGIFAGAFWGFDQGWNEDILVGGRYHNGNAGYYQGYPPNEFLSLGGGEAPTGYVNYSDERKTYFSDIGGRVLPESTDSLVHTFSMYNSPNESYWENSSSRICFDWRYWNVAYMGKDNQLMKSIDGGSSFMPVYTFTNNPSNQVLWIEQSFSDPEVFYLQVVINNVSRLMRSPDGGATWAPVTLPVSGKREMVFTLGYSGSDELWVAFTYGSNGHKVYHTIDGGASWTNLTSSLLDDLRIKAIACQAGTDGTIYIAALNGSVFYKNNSLPEWQALVDGLPVGTDPLRLVPFYRDRKLRLGTWNMAIWETSLPDTSRLMANFSADYASFYCPGDTIRFVNHSVCSGNATCQWSFPGGTPSTSTLYNPSVVYSQPGSYDVTLVVTDGNQRDTLTRTGFINASAFAVFPVNEGFEEGNLPDTWRLKDDGEDGVNWAVTGLAGGFGASNNSLLFDNFDFDVTGKQDEVWTPKLDFTDVMDASVLFDVAYAEYGGQYSDTMAVLATGDCGVTYREYYRKGGQDLATAPDYTAGIFIPDATQWRTDSIVVSDFAGQPEVIVAFRNIGHWGQALYVDNVRVNVLHPLGIRDLASGGSVLISPNPNDGHFRILYRDLAGISCQTEILNSTGSIVYTGTDKPGTSGWTKEYDLTGFSKGIYLVRIHAGNSVVSGKLIIF
ncbi:MAG TPA: T9SS type A sorting domain-containing protein [Bacteroidales bacterium]|nr:T9SS type A sorting domain-containing protein [Bacteroidales bacterium]